MSGPGFPGVREDAHPFKDGAPISAEARPHLFTVEEVLKLAEMGLLPPDGEGRIELADGRIEVMPVDGDLHVYRLRRLTQLIYEALLAHPDLRARLQVHVKATLRLGDRGFREPDLMVTTLVPADRLPEPADVVLLVEVSISSRTRDLEDKRVAYASAGVGEYWVWDEAFSRMVMFHQPEDGDYAFKQTRAEGLVTAAAAPKLSLAITALLD